MIEAGQRARLGDVLVSENLVTPEQLSASLNLQQESGRQLGAILVEQGLLDQRVLTQALARQLGLPTIDLRRERPTDEALAIVPESTAREFDIMPMRLVDDVLDVAIANGADPAVREALERLPVSAVNIHLAPPQDVQFALNTHYRVLSSVDDQVQQFWADATPVTEIVEVAGGDAPIIQLVEQDRRPGPARPGLRHPRRAHRRTAAHPLPHRRRAPRGAEPAGDHRARARQPHQDHGGDGHRRTSTSAGRPVPDEHRRRRPRRPRRDRARRSGARRPCCVCSTSAAR